jgi:hypothetical protein
VRDQCQPHQLPTIDPPNGDYRLQSRANNFATVLSAILKCGAFTAFAQVSPDRSQFGFGSFVFFQHVDQVAGDQQSAGRKQDGIDDNRYDQVTGNGNRQAAEAYDQAISNGPENADKRNRREEGREQSDGQVNGEICRNPCVLGDSKLGSPTSTVKRTITLIETEKCYKATVYFFIQPRTAPASRSFASGRSSESKNCDPELFLNEELLICIRLP